MSEQSISNDDSLMSCTIEEIDALAEVEAAANANKKKEQTYETLLVLHNKARACKCGSFSNSHAEAPVQLRKMMDDQKSEAASAKAEDEKNENKISKAEEEAAHLTASMQQSVDIYVDLKAKLKKTLTSQEDHEAKTAEHIKRRKVLETSIAEILITVNEAKADHAVHEEKRIGNKNQLEQVLATARQIHKKVSEPPGPSNTNTNSSPALTRSLRKLDKAIKSSFPQELKTGINLTQNFDTAAASTSTAAAATASTAATSTSTSVDTPASTASQSAASRASSTPRTIEMDAYVNSLTPGKKLRLRQKLAEKLN